MALTQLFTIKVRKQQVVLKLTFDKFIWDVYCPHQNPSFDFAGSVLSGRYNSDGTKIISYIDARELEFVRHEIEEKITKILKKHKILKRAK